MKAFPSTQPCSAPLGQIMFWSVPCWSSCRLHPIETIRYQHTADFRDTDMIACVFAANQISKKLEFGFGGNSCIEEFPQSVQARLGGNLDQVIASVGDLNPLFEEAKVFAKL